MPVSMFATMDRAKREAQRRGHESIDLSIGSSDLTPPSEALDAVRVATTDPAANGYCLHACTSELREAAVSWYAGRYGLQVDAEANALALLGAQEGLANLLLATTDPGDTIFLPDPGYPSYFGAAAVAGLEVSLLPLKADNDFLPDLSAVPSGVAERSRAMVLNYPNNPTAAVAGEAFLREAVSFCCDNEILLIHDFPYVDMVYGNYEAPSVLALPGGLEIGIELFSCSKSFHMGGFRMGWAIGNADAIASLAQVKGSIDFNQYLGIQRAAVVALRQPREKLRRDAAVFEGRRDALVTNLNHLGWNVPCPKATMYVWSRLPEGFHDSFSFTVQLAQETGVCLAPGRGFGERGEGFVRFALVREPEVLIRAVGRIREFIGRTTPVAGGSK
jgi:aspartate/methionine/tyrosine aminotransferase